MVVKEVAEVIDDIEDERLRFRWEDADSDTEYLEFKISTSPVTGETILNIIDFADEDEVEDQKQLWTSSNGNSEEGNGWIAKFLFAIRSKSDLNSV